MSKAVLVMDMPKNCMECMFCCEIDEGIEACCTITAEPDDEDLCRDIEEYYCQCKPDWCPLKQMPEKKPENELRQCKGSTFGVWEVPLPKNKGWNACIDTICGKE